MIFGVSGSDLEPGIRPEPGQGQESGQVPVRSGPEIGPGPGQEPGSQPEPGKLVKSHGQDQYYDQSWADVNIFVSSRLRREGILLTR